MDYNLLLSGNAKTIKPSGIRKFFDIVAEMKDVISLGVGEPDFVTPWHIREAGIDSLTRGRTFYTSNWGLIELREAISNYLKRRYGLSYNPRGEIVVTVGGSEAIDMCIRALVNEGDEVIIPQPSFVCYEPITVLANGVPVFIETKEEDEFRVTAKQIKEKITDKTKLLILPYPNNPTGAVLGKKDLEEIAEVLRGTNIMVLSDEIYCELTYTEGHVSIAQIPGMQERTILVNGFSKAYAMTGWRLGYACGPEAVISAMTKIHQFGIMSAPTMAQDAAIDALNSGDEDVKYMTSQYNYRRRFLVDALKKMGIDCFEPLGAFYVFPNIKKFGMSSEDFCEKLLIEEKVAVIPGNAFGDSGEGYVRISYAYSIEKISEALTRIERFINKLKL